MLLASLQAMNNQLLHMETMNLTTRDDLLLQLQIKINTFSGFTLMAAAFRAISLPSLHTRWWEEAEDVRLIWSRTRPGWLNKLFCTSLEILKEAEDIPKEINDKNTKFWKML